MLMHSPPKEGAVEPKLLMPKATPPNFLNLLDEVYEQEDAAYIKGASEGYRHNPSSASMVKPRGDVAGACLRSLYYKATKEEA